MQFNSIQILRAIAVIFVILHHVRGYIIVMGNDSILTKIPGIMAYGAELFFAISGFLMAHLIDKGYENFLMRRLARIYPTFFLIAIIAIVVKYFTIGSPIPPDLLKALSLLPFGITTFPLNVEWTLIYEVFFYFICTVFTYKNLNRFFPHFLLVWLTIILMATFAFKVPPNPLPALHSIFYEIFNMFFISGALAFYVSKKYSPHNNKICYLFMLPGFLFVVLSPIWIKHPWFLTYNFYFLAPCCFLLLLGSYSFKSSHQNSLLHNVMIKLGDYSYALYLVHVPIIIIIYTLYQQHVGPLNTKIAIVTLLISLYIGWWFGKVDVFLHGIAKKIFGNKKTNIPKTL